MSHNTVVIEVLIAVVLVITIIVAIRLLMNGGADEHSGAGMSSELEASLKKMLEQSQHAAAPAAAGVGANPEELSKYQAEIAELKRQLEDSQKHIEEIKASSTPSDGGGGEAAQAQLNQQLQELQAKLAEYEIISEDIADLSNYKEQNAKLQKEIEALKAGGAVASTPAAPPAAVAPAQEVAAPQAEAPVAEVAPEPVATPEPPPPSTVEAAPAPEVIAEPVAPPPTAAPAASAASASPEEGSEGVVDDDLMAEFAAAVAKQKEVEGAAKTASSAASAQAADAPVPPVQAAPAPPTSAPAAPPPPAAVAEEAVEPVAAVAAPEDAGVDLGAMNVDKVLEEATHIPDVEAELTPEQALGQGLDENKLLEEANALDAAPAPESNEDKKLMEQFESFVKKENA